MKIIRFGIYCVCFTTLLYIVVMCLADILISLFPDFLIVRRIQEYATNVIAAGKLTNVDFPKGIMVIEEQVMGIIVQLSRLVLHNRAVYQDLYFGIIHDQVPVPKFMDENNDEFDPSIVKAMQLLDSEPIDKLVMTKRMKN